MEKLSLYERLLKNKNRLKVQAVSLVLAATAVITTGCGSKETPKPTPDKPGIEDVIDNNKEDKMVELTVENLDSEAEKITNELVKKGMDTDFESVRSTLLHLNKDSFTDEEYYSLFEPSENEFDIFVATLNGILKHNSATLRSGDLSNLIDYKDFCRNEDSYKVIGKLDETSLELAKVILKGSKNINKEIVDALEPLNGLVTGEEQIKVGNETFKYDDLTNEAKDLIVFYGLIATNFVKYSCDSQYLTGETKQFCDDVYDYTFILGSDATYAVRDNIISNQLSKTK